MHILVEIIKFFNYGYFPLNAGIYTVSQANEKLEGTLAAHIQYTTIQIYNASISLMQACLF